jgi:hypothetical protein
MGYTKPIFPSSNLKQRARQQGQGNWKLFPLPHAEEGAGSSDIVPG